MYTKIDLEFIANQLSAWYLQHHRDLPWRITKDPYKIWLSEIILQQTRVAQGLDYYLRFTNTYATVEELAAANEEEVLRLWQGLGYYSRARNLHTCAKTIVIDYGGKFPSTYQELLKLKGVGSYTAAAIASFAFGEAVPVVDGNVYRVLSRLFGIETDINSTQAKKEFFELGDALIPDADPGTHNQAIMEFGAMQCTPHKPNCLFCPLQDVCVAYKESSQQRLPVKIKKVKVKNRYFFYFVITYKGKLALKQRGPKDIWQGLYDFPLYESAQPMLVEDVLHHMQEQWPWLQDASIDVTHEEVKHILSHQRLHARFVHIDVSHFEGSAISPVQADLQFYEGDQVRALPKPVLVNNHLPALDI